MNEKILNLNNLDKINNIFSKYNSATIFGKGPTFKNLKKKNDNELFITINQTSNEIEDVDMICFNDYHNLGKIRVDVFKKLKFLLIPEYLNVNFKLNEEYSFYKLKEELKGIFNGYYIVYNRPICLNKNPNFISLPTNTSSCNTANDFICVYLNNFIKKINFYGDGMVDQDKFYHQKFPVGYGTYTKSRLVSIRINIKKICNKYNINYYLN